MFYFCSWSDLILILRVFFFVYRRGLSCCPHISVSFCSSTFTKLFQLKHSELNSSEQQVTRNTVYLLHNTHRRLNVTSGPLLPWFFWLLANNEIYALPPLAGRESWPECDSILFCVNFRYRNIRWILLFELFLNNSTKSSWTLLFGLFGWVKWSYTRELK